MGTDEILALNDRLDALIDSAVNIAISVLRPRSEVHDLSSIQRLFGSLCSPMRELVALWDRLAFESEPAGSSSEDGGIAFDFFPLRNVCVCIHIKIINQCTLAQA